MNRSVSLGTEQCRTLETQEANKKRVSEPRFTRKRHLWLYSSIWKYLRRAFVTTLTIFGVCVYKL